jgi:hypothetical protein
MERQKEPDKRSAARPPEIRALMEAQGGGSLMTKCAFEKWDGRPCGGSLSGLRVGATHTIRPTS